MADKMLIDASHAEETRVVVVRGNRIEEFDFESQHKKQLRGNIYLAKVTRVEPSLQAAFVDYGGNRHGFLAFSEIHPDYYQIPLADRQALLAAEAEAERQRSEREDDDAEAEEAEAAEDDGDEKPAKQSRSRGGRQKRSRRGRSGKSDADAQSSAKDDDAHEDDGGDASDEGDDGNENDDPKSIAASVETDSVSEPAPPSADETADEERDPGEVDLEAAKFVEGKVKGDEADPRKSTRGPGDDDDDDDDESDRRRPSRRRARRKDGNEDADEENGGRIESVGAEDAMEEVPDRSVRKPRKQYRIQEVIKRRQILLVQVVKEERGNKGAALTTYLSLAGRYSVLMPNTARGGGISRKITNAQDRKRLKEIAKGLEVPQGMGVILRTAGANRTKAEVKRDFEYLMRLWENVRSLTLASTAPCLVYEEGSLIKRSIRDLYNKDIGQVIVAGEEGYREAKDFMKMLMPSHAKVVQPYREVHPIFSRSGIEAQLDRMLQPQVTLKSGGYIIINQTEALVAIDVNSGRSTREHSIEDTALQTNLEAADEVARQLRLRDLAGLIVVDFIDMEEKRNNRSVEKRLKDALKNDRARIQVGRISHFGLLEMSRQRIRASVLESTTQVCEHCGGTGHVRSQSSVALHVIRSIEDFLIKSNTHDIVVRTTPATALYVLNQKRESIVEMERRFGVVITIEADATIGSAHLAIDRGAAVEEPVKIENRMPDIEEDEDDAPLEPLDEQSEPDEAEEEGQGDRKRKRRRKRRGGRDRDTDSAGEDTQASEPEASDDGRNESTADDGSDDGRSRKRRRRGKRGGRRNRGGTGENGVQGENDGQAETRSDETGEETPASANADEVAIAGDGAPASESGDKAEIEAVETAAEDLDAPVEAVASEEAPAADEEAAEPAPKKKRASRAKAAKSENAGEAKKPARRRRSAKTEEPETQASASSEDDTASQPAGETAVPRSSDETVSEEPTSEPAASEADAGAAGETGEPVVVSNGDPVEPPAEEDPAEKSSKPKKVGWWQRRSFF